VSERDRSKVRIRIPVLGLDGPTSDEPTAPGDDFAARVVVVPCETPPDEMRRRVLRYAASLERDHAVCALSPVLSPASAAIKEMLDLELAEQERVRCPRCGGPTLAGYPGGDPENGPAGRRCRDESCQFERDSEEMETVYVVVSSSACTGCVDGVDVQVCCDLPSAAEVVADVIGTWVDPEVLTGENLFMRHGDGWRMVTDDAPNDRGYTPEWVQVSKRRVR
jgi:hypothetical protein